MKKTFALLLALQVLAGPLAAQVRTLPTEAAPLPALPSAESWDAASQASLSGISDLSQAPELGQPLDLPSLSLPSSLSAGRAEQSSQGRFSAAIQRRLSTGEPASAVSAVRASRQALETRGGETAQFGRMGELFDRSANLSNPYVDLPALNAAPESGSSRKHTHEKGVFSNNRLKTFEWSPEDYALEYLLDAEREPGPKPFQFLVGIAVHETMEKVYKAVEAGRDGRAITADEVAGIYNAAFDRGLAEENYASRDDFKPEEYRRRGEIFVRRKFEQLKPFKLPGRIVSIESEARFDLVDPGTGKAYRFYGRPDRVRVVGDTVWIEDWKTHANPPSLEQLKRDDYQLGLYAIGLRQLQPELFRGRKIKLAWYYKEFSHELDADEAYLRDTADRVLRVLHGIEQFTERYEAEKAQWEKRAKPADGAVPAAVKKQLDELGTLESKARAKRLELRQLDAMLREKENGLLAYADAKNLNELDGKTHRVAFTRKTEKKVPTLETDAKANAEVIRILKEEGAWKDFSQLQYAAVKSFAERQGHPDHAAYERMRPHLKLSHSSELVVRENDEDLGSMAGVARYRLQPATESEPERESGMYSASKVRLFEKSPKDYALQYLFRVKNETQLSYELLVGLACHETLEDLFNALKGGRRAEDISFKDVLADYRRLWKEREAEGRYKAAKGWRASDYRRKGEEFLRAKWEQLYPFNQGEIQFLERRMHFDVTDPETGKVYRFQGIPDRVMIEGDTVVIHDWKTHFVPPTEEEIRDEDFQLALYTHALRQLYPNLMAGKKVRLVWDFKDKPVVIEATDEYVNAALDRVVKLLREVEKFTAEVDKDREKWERLAGMNKPPKSAADAKRWVDSLAKLTAERDAKQKELDELTNAQRDPRRAVLDYALESGRWEVETPKYVASVRKKPVTDIPTKKDDPQGNDAVIAALKETGLWEAHSQLSYPSLKAALKRMDGPHKAALLKIAALLQDSSETKMKLEALPEGGTQP
jgi:hypothetical protein